mgnify:CR=1 FL=1
MRGQNLVVRLKIELIMDKKNNGVVACLNLHMMIVYCMGQMPYPDQCTNFRIVILDRVILSIAENSSVMS